MNTHFLRRRFGLTLVCLVVASLGSSCGKKIQREGTVNDVQEINDLVVLKARFADIIEAEDNDMKITYIARMEAYYAVDYSKIDPKTTTTNVMNHGQLQECQFVTVKVPSIHLLSEPTLVRKDNDEGSEVFDIEGGLGKSAGRLKSVVQEAAIKLAKVEAGKDSWMKLARESAEDCIKQLYLASHSDSNNYVFFFDWENEKLQNPLDRN